MSDAPKTKEITMQEAMALTGLSRTAIYNRIESGELVPLPKPAAFKKRPVTRFLRADVEKLMRG